MINKFAGEYEFLSNFFLSPIICNGDIYYPSVEHAFQAQKTHSRMERLMISKARTPGQAKRMGRNVTLRDDWETIKYSKMSALIHLKFTNPTLKSLLLETGNEKLEEGNWWHDNYWGNCYCEKCKDIQGKNMLGKILMEERKLIRAEEQE